jgi:hypothetical protein
VTEERSFARAAKGVGPVWTLAHCAAPFISAGKLVRVLEGWWAPFPGYFLYDFRDRAVTRPA